MNVVAKFPKKKKNRKLKWRKKERNILRQYRNEELEKDNDKWNNHSVSEI